jgi:hypothetical protein
MIHSGMVWFLISFFNLGFFQGSFLKIAIPAGQKAFIFLFFWGGKRFCV